MLLQVQVLSNVAAVQYIVNIAHKQLLAAWCCLKLWHAISPEFKPLIHTDFVGFPVSVPLVPTRHFKDHWGASKPGDQPATEHQGYQLHGAQC